MKIDFNEKGMTINFDKVPKFLYFNEEGRGCGQVFLDGVRRKGLQYIKIEAHTRNEHGWPPLEYRIKYWEDRASHVIGNMADGLCLNVRIADIEEFQAFISVVKKLLEDNRIHEDIRKEFYEKLCAAFNTSEKEDLHV